MTLGLSTATFTSLHVVLSLIGIASGIIVLLGMLGAKRLDGWTALFLATTMLTSVTVHLGRSGGRDACALCLPPAGSLALDLRGQCRGGTLLQ